MTGTNISLSQVSTRALQPGDVVLSSRTLSTPRFIGIRGRYLRSSYTALAAVANIGGPASSWLLQTLATSGHQAVATDSAGTWIIVGNSGIMQRSVDNGLSWSTVTSGFGSTNILSVATDGAGVWIAVGASGVLSRSTNNGATWGTVTSGFGTTAIRAVATDRAGVWIAGGDSGVMTRSTNNGASWSTVTSGFGTTAIRAVATDRAGVWAAVGSFGTMTVSTNNGVAWTAARQALTSDYFSVATDRNGLWLVGTTNSSFLRFSNNFQNVVRILGEGEVFGVTISGIATNAAGTWVASGITNSIFRSSTSDTEMYISSIYASDLTSAYLYTGET